MEPTTERTAEFIVTVANMAKEFPPSLEEDVSDWTDLMDWAVFRAGDGRVGAEEVNEVSLNGEAVYGADVGDGGYL